MRPLRALVIYSVGVFVGGALLAPWLYWLTHLFAHDFPKIAAEPFHRFVERSFLILALAGLWPLLRVLGVTSWRDVGVVGPQGQGGKLFGGLLVGFLSLVVVAGTALLCGNRILIQNVSGHQMVDIIFQAVGTAVVVAIVEELLFRGGIFGGLRKFFYWPLALLISSVTYALAHFLRRAELTGDISWDSGIFVLPRLFGGFVDFRALVPEFMNLTLAGLLLGLVYQRTGNLYFSIGLHAGWIFWLKVYGALTTTALHAPTWFFGTSKMIDGWLALIVLIATLVPFTVLLSKPRNEPFSIPQ